MPTYTLHRTQILPISLDEAWNFISRPENLKKITPKNMGFDIKTKNLPEKMYPGMIIEYKVKPLLGIPTQWVSEITHIREKEFFIDVQRSGPYQFWHHQHFLEEIPEGVKMTDIITYKPPFGILGGLANLLIIKRKLNSIFNYRKKKLEMLFPVYNL